MHHGQPFFFLSTSSVRTSMPPLMSFATATFSVHWGEEKGFLDSKNRPCQYRMIRLNSIVFDGDCIVHALYVDDRVEATCPVDRGPFLYLGFDVAQHQVLRVCCSAVYTFAIDPERGWSAKDLLVCSGCGVVQEKRWDEEHTLCKECFVEMLGIKTYHGVVR